MASIFHWFGDAVARDVERAAIIGVNTTMGECITTAMDLVHVRFGYLQGSLRLEPAHRISGGVLGTWGSFDINYAKWQEVLPTARGGKPYLRPSADHNYPHLPGHIRAAML